MFLVVILVVGIVGAGTEKTGQFIDSGVKTVKQTTETVIQKAKDITK